jgi:uncharacterized iron-regulated membrane protein
LIKIVLWLLLIWGGLLFIFTISAGYRQYNYYSENNKDLFWVNLHKSEFIVYLCFSLILIFNGLYLLL